MIERLVKRAARHCDEAEVYLENSKFSSCSSEGGRVNSFSRGVQSGFGVRVVVGGKVGFSSGNSLEDFDRVVRKAVSLSGFGNKFYSFPGKAVYRKVRGIYSCQLDEIDDSFLYDKTVLMNRVMRKEGARPASAGVSSSVSRFWVANTNGLVAEEKGTSIGCSAFAMAGRSEAYEGEEKTGLRIDFGKVGRDAAREALACRAKRKGPSGKMPVILKPKASSGFLESGFLPSFNGETVFMKASFLSGREGEKLFSGKLTVEDSGILPEGISSSRCDREGTPSAKTLLVKRGVVSAFIHNQESGFKSGGKSTGNGQRSYSSSPSVGSANTVFSAGKRDLEEMIGSLKRGILVSSLSGLHNINSFSGDFSVEAKNAFLVKEGRVACPLRSCVISGNIFRLLEDAEFSKDRRVVGDTTIGSLLGEMEISS